jgi:anti-sigma regulatory factor (Ser/Thr protein kinase)
VLRPGSTYAEEFPATPGSVSQARTALAEFAATVGVTGAQLDDVRLVVSEAVTNVVQHAYGEGAGTFQITASHMPGELWLLVSDDGQGMQPGSVHGGLGLGLAVIAQVADEFQIVRRSSGGTQLEMRFRIKSAGRRPEFWPGFCQAVTLSLV